MHLSCLCKLIYRWLLNSTTAPIPQNTADLVYTNMEYKTNMCRYAKYDR